MISAEDKVAFSDEDIARLTQIEAKYPQRESALMGVLWYAQHKFGWISPNVMQLVADYLGISPSTVEGVATFYTMFYKKQVGKYHIQVCTNVSCMINSGVELFEHLSQKYGIGNMQTTADGKFSLEEVECMGACGGAPLLAINEDYYESMTIEKADALLDTL